MKEKINPSTPCSKARRLLRIDTESGVLFPRPKGRSFTSTSLSVLRRSVLSLPKENAAERIKDIIKNSILTNTCLLYDEEIVEKIKESANLIIKTLKKGGKILIFGNGGSAADSQHFAAELVGRFQKERRGLAALALTTDSSILTSLSNDYSPDIIFKRQIEALAKPYDLAFAISTSGKSKNVLYAVKQAKTLKLKTIGLTGSKGGELAKIVDIPLIAPSSITARVQESHVLIIHIICEMVEEAFAK